MRRAWKILVVIVMAATARQSIAQGIVLAGAGSVNKSFGGASTAAPLDAIGAQYWNPATNSALENELSVGLELILPVLETKSSIAGLGGGSTDAEPGVGALPSVGWIYRAEDSPITLGLGILPLAGFKTNYPASTTNPIFLPQSNSPGIPGGLGRVYTEAMFLQIAPTVTLALSNELSVSFGPTLTAGSIIIDPLFVSPLLDADGSGVGRWSSGRGSRVHWGGGAQVGVFYQSPNCWNFGASLKSPQWMEEFRYKTEDELGRPITHEKDVDLPMIFSVGTSYNGIEDIVLAVDLRYFDYRNTNGLGESGFRPNGSLKGINQSNVFALATGAQFKLTDCWTARMGYIYNTSPMDDADATLGIPAPLHYQHQFHWGATYQWAEKVRLHAHYGYSPTHELDGPILTPAGRVPGSSLQTSESVHMMSMGITVNY